MLDKYVLFTLFEVPVYPAMLTVACTSVTIEAIASTRISKARGSRFRSKTLDKAYNTLVQVPESQQ
jgi:hypothetical protein